MYRLPYFPFPSDEYSAAMDVTALHERRLIEIDERYAEEIALKREILALDGDYYCHAPPSTEPLQWETLEHLLPHLADGYPHHFTLAQTGNRWAWTNRLLSLQAEFILGDPASLPLSPLDWIARQVQEDLLLMEVTTEGEIVLAAGHLCFGAEWSLEEKIGKSFLEIHAPVPQFEMGLAGPSQLLMERLKAGRPVCRVNWSVAATDRLNLSPATAHEWHHFSNEITDDNAGGCCFLRLERQTLTRLPKTRGILFTIHTYRAPLSDLADEPDKLRRFTNVLRTLPPVVARYKGISGYRDALLGYLENLCRSDTQN